jgi:iron complex transport system ATP-binding protein
VTLVVDRLTIRERERALLSELSLEVDSSSFVVLVGPNGAGKSTLLRAAVGVLPPSSGTVTLGGDPVRKLKGRKRAARISWMPQRSVSYEPTQVLDFVGAARFRFDETVTQARQASRACLAKVGAEGFADRDLSTLSGGEQQRVALAALLAQEAPLLLLDEPAAHLDPRQQLEVHSLLVTLWREGKGMLCATHDVNLLSHALRPNEGGRVRVIGLRSGRMLFEHAYDAPGLATALGELFEVDIQAVERSGRRYFIEAPRETA